MVLICLLYVSLSFIHTFRWIFKNVFIRFSFVLYVLSDLVDGQVEGKPFVEEMRSGQIEEDDVAKAGHTALDHVLHVGTADRKGENIE